MSLQKQLAVTRTDMLPMDLTLSSARSASTIAKTRFVFDSTSGSDGCASHEACEACKSLAVFSQSWSTACISLQQTINPCKPLHDCHPACEHVKRV